MATKPPTRCQFCLIFGFSCWVDHRYKTTAEAGEDLDNFGIFTTPDGAPDHTLRIADLNPGSSTTLQLSFFSKKDGVSILCPLFLWSHWLNPHFLESSVGAAIHSDIWSPQRPWRWSPWYSIKVVPCCTSPFLDISSMSMSFCSWLEESWRYDRCAIRSRSIAGPCVHYLVWYGAGKNPSSTPHSEGSSGSIQKAAPSG